MSRPRGGEGYGSLIVLALAAVMSAFLALLVALGLVAVSRHRAAAAADLAAQAAADWARQGQEAACAAALRAAEATGASLLSCRLVGLNAVVVTTVRPGGALGRLGAARAYARHRVSAPGDTLDAWVVEGSRPR